MRSILAAHSTQEWSTVLVDARICWAGLHSARAVGRSRSISSLTGTRRTRPSRRCTATARYHSLGLICFGSFRLVLLVFGRIWTCVGLFWLTTENVHCLEEDSWRILGPPYFSFLAPVCLSPVSLSVFRSTCLAACLLSLHGV